MVERELVEEVCQELSRVPSMLYNMEYVRQMMAYNKTLEIRVSLPDIIEYLKGLMEHIFSKEVTM